MKSNYTPGPWKVAETYAGQDGATIAVYPVKTHLPMGNIEGKSAPIARVYLEQDDFTSANAHLIAAAPEMLEMIRLMLVHNEDLEDKVIRVQTGLDKRDVETLAHKIARVLTKAEGGK